MSDSSGVPRARRSRRRVLVAVLGAMGLAVAVATTAAPSADASAPVPPTGWARVFLDDFDGPAGSGVDTSKWQYATGTSYPGGPADWGTGEVETMTSSTSNVALDGNGNLLITPRRQANKWTSGRIETIRSDFQPPAGGRMRVEARLRMPNVTGTAAKGYWPAFWMLGEPFRGNYQNWPGIGELDVMENVQGLNTTWATMHCGTNPGGPCDEPNGIGNSTACPNATCQSGFHTYTMEWDRSASPEAIRFSVDGVDHHTVTANHMDATTWANATDHGFFVILNVAMGGAFPNAFGGGPTGATEPGHPMVVDYVQILQS